MNKFVVYTATFGDKVGIMPQRKFAGVDFICFSDKPRKVKGWTVKLLPEVIPGDAVRNNRHYKILPHHYLSGYEASIYIDSNFICKQLPVDFFMNQLKQTPLLVFDHNQTKKDQRNCIYKEYNALMKVALNGNPKETPEILERHKAFLLAEGYPENNGLISGGVLIRKHNEFKVIEAMELWWQMINKLSKRDQLSFNYVAWKQQLKFGYLQGDIRRGNPWFYYAGKSEESLFYSLLKYKIRTMRS